MTEMGEHRVTLLGASWRRNDDPSTSRDPRMRAVVGALATLPAPEMRPEFRAELRAQLVAITPRIVAESAPDAGVGRLIDIVPARSRPTPQGRPSSAEPRHADGFLARLKNVHPGRPLAVVAALIVAFSVLLGGAVLMSRKALPGDALYGLKRASERFQLATAGSDVERAKDHLDFAKTRADEARALLGRAGGSALGGAHASGSSAETAKLVRSTLQSADGDVRAAARLLGSDAVRHSSSSPLSAMTAWAPAQAQRLQAIADASSDPAVRTQAESSRRLVQSAQARASALATRVSCGCLSTTRNDDLGPLPSLAPVTTQTRSASPTSAPRTGTRTHPRTGTTGTGTGTGGTTTGTGAPAKSSTGPTSSSSTKPPLIQLPPLVLGGSSSTPNAPTSCSATLNVPILGIGVGLCNGVSVNTGH